MLELQWGAGRMRIVAHGFDLVECRRIQDVLERHGDRFLARILTDMERRYVESKRDPLPHIAGRFAAKEAVLKVLGTGWRGAIAWTDVEVVNDRAGQPVVRLSGECERIAQGLGVTRVLVSISHTEKHAAASAIGLADDGAAA